MKLSNAEQLITISKEINILESRKQIFIKSISDDLQKTILQWSEIIPIEDFSKAILAMYGEFTHKKHGRDFFTWNQTPYIQTHFEQFMQDALKSEDKFWYKPGYCSRFFVLKKYKPNGRNRSSIKTESWVIDENMLTYTYSGTAYDGFGNSMDSVQQKLVIDLEKNEVTSYDDSTVISYFDGTQHHHINTNFINKLIKKNKIK